uniref:Uncharacterized protein n=1 Tax=Kellev virus TaxID=2800921 RepID=A0A894KLP4_9VIRU|nr:MAG: hypothetical protein [Kellev virus]
MGVDYSLVNGSDFQVRDQYSELDDEKDDVSNTSLEVVSVPPIWDKQPVGLAQFEFALTSKYFPKVALFDFSVTFIANRNIFVPKFLRNVNVSVWPDVKLKLIQPIRNLYSSRVRNDNWFQVKFCQLVEILDPTVQVKFNVTMNKLFYDVEWPPNTTTLDVSTVLTWYTSVTNFFSITPGEYDELKGSASTATCEVDWEHLEHPPCSISAASLQIVDHSDQPTSR